jgi:RHS repeat-associated protein
VTTAYLYDAFGQLVAEYGVPTGSGGTEYLTADHLGSTRLVTDSGGNVLRRYDYLPFGEELFAGVNGRSSKYPVQIADGDSIKFTGKERDAETGIDYFGARYFSAAQGRFISPDFAGPDLTNPQTLNKYRYALNNPFAYVDRNGLYEEDVHRDLTYSLALAAGISDSSASRIASADQGVDDNPATSPFKGQEARALWHFTDPAQREFLWDEFSEHSTPENLGKFLHPEQDSYSHEGFGPILGQATYWPVWDQTAPDKTYNDPEKADRMAQDTFNHLVAANPLLGGYTHLPWNIVSSFVLRFNRARTPEEKKKILKQLNDKSKANIEEQRRKREAPAPRPGGCPAEFRGCEVP